jgi:hypothetical protein
MRSSVRTRSLLIILLLPAGLWAYFFIPGCNPIDNVGDPKKPLPEYHPDRPLLFIHQTPSQRGTFYGVIVAIYPDGRIIRTTSESALGESYIRGRLSTEDFAKARRILHDSGILSTKPGGSVVLHSRVENLGVRYGARVSSWGHSPDFENTNNSSSYNPRITKLKNDLLALPIQDSKPEPAAEWYRYPTEFYEGDPSNQR